MGFITKLKKYLKGQGGIECMECGNYAEGENADWYGQGDSDVGVYPTCPECGSGKTKQGILVTRDE